MIYDNNNVYHTNIFMRKMTMSVCSIAALLGIILTFASCKSKEEKIAEAIELLNQEKYAEGLALYQEIEDVQDTTLLIKLAQLYADGKGVEQDSAKALQLWEKSAGLGHPYSMVELGFAYEFGRGGFKIDMKKALEYYEKAGEKNNPYGLYNAAMIYIYDKGKGAVDKNPEKGIQIVEKGSRLKKCAIYERIRLHL